MSRQHSATAPSATIIRILTLIILVACIALFLLFVRSPSATVQGQSTESSGPTPGVRQAVQQTEIGRNCMQGCHNAIVETFVGETHGKSAKFLHDSRAANCDICHANSEKHAETSTTTRSGGNVVNPANLTSSLASESCLQCHSRDRYLSSWRGGKHDRGDMSCLSCHSVHHTKLPQWATAGRQRALADQTPDLIVVKSSGSMLASLTVEETCFSCHKEKRKAQFQRSTHLLRTESRMIKVSCSNCHNPHGGEGRTMLQRSTVNDTCFQCHAEKRGPLLWEHTPVQESCLVCHTPHGSNNIALLTKRTHHLCQQCHINIIGRHPNVAGFDVFTYNKGCVNCHTQIHGSNHPSGRAFTR